MNEIKQTSNGITATLTSEDLLNYKLKTIEANGNTYEVSTLYSHIQKIIKSIATDQLNHYINQNIENHKIYFYEGKIDNDVLVFTLNDITGGIRDIGYKNLYDGIINCSYSYDVRFNFNVMSDTVSDICILVGYGRDKKAVNHSPLQMVYSDRLKHLKLAQIKKGTAPKFIMELNRIHEFLKDKKSVKINLKDGRVLKWSERLYLNGLVDIIDDQFYLLDSYFFAPRLNLPFREKMLFSNVESLQYNRTILEINHDNLKVGVTV